MESQAQKRAKKIDVQKYLAITPHETSGAESIRRLLICYLNSHRNAEFSNYEEIGAALRKEYGLAPNQCTRGAISKVVSHLPDDLIFSDGTYYFQKIDGSYALRERFGADEPILTQLFLMKHAFTHEAVHIVGKDTYVFAVNPEKLEVVAECFKQLLGAACFDVMPCERFIVVMLDPEHEKAETARKILKSFFKEKNHYEKKHKEHKKIVRQLHKG